MVVIERAKKGSEEWENDSISKRLGYLNAKATKVSEYGVTAKKRENPNYKLFENNRIVEGV